MGRSALYRLERSIVLGSYYYESRAPYDSKSNDFMIHASPLHVCVKLKALGLALLVSLKIDTERTRFIVHDSFCSSYVLSRTMERPREFKVVEGGVSGGFHS